MWIDPETNRSIITEEYERGRIDPRGLPYYYQVHLHMPCNQKCIMCIPDGRHSKASMSFADFLAFFNQVKHVARNITLIGGETLLYPHIDDVLDLLARHRIGVNIITNATMLDEGLCERLTRLHHLNLKCSIDAASAETYRKIRGVDVFDRVTGNLEMFARSARGRTHIKQILVFVVMRENLHEVLPFIDLAATLDPYEIQFHPVRHVQNWNVENGTGWQFVGAEQICESFADQYRLVMRNAQAACGRLSIRCETLPI